MPRWIKSQQQQTQQNTNVRARIESGVLDSSQSISASNLGLNCALDNQLADKEAASEKVLVSGQSDESEEQLLYLFCLIGLTFFLCFAMTNFMSKIFSGSNFASGQHRRRSLATPNNQQTITSHLEADNNNSNQQRVNFHASTLSLRPSSSNNTQKRENQRRASRSSLHSVSAILFGAFTTSNTNNNNANATSNGKSYVIFNIISSKVCNFSSKSLFLMKSALLRRKIMGGFGLHSLEAITSQVFLQKVAH